MQKLCVVFTMMLFLVACGRVVPEPELTLPPTPVAEQGSKPVVEEGYARALAAIAVVDVLVPDGSGQLHKGKALLPIAVADDVDRFLAGSKVILKSDSDATQQERKAPEVLSFEERIEKARSQMAKQLAGNSPSTFAAFFAVFFEGQEVVAWTGKMLPRRAFERNDSAGAPKKTKNWFPHYDTLGPGYDRTADYYCEAGTELYGTTTSATTGSSKIRRVYPYDGTQEDWTWTGNYYSTFGLGPDYINAWPWTWRYVELDACVGSCQTVVNTNLKCYFYG